MNDLTITIYCLIIAAFLPYLAKLPLAIAMGKSGTAHRSGYDNKYPRDQQRRLEGFGARCLAAHENSFEALIIFAPAVLLAIATDSLVRHVAVLSVAFIVFRILYLICYWADWDRLRTTVWLLGIGCCFAIMLNCVP